MAEDFLNPDFASDIDISFSGGSYSSTSVGAASVSSPTGGGASALDWAAIGLNLFGLGLGLDAQDDMADLQVEEAARRAAVSKGQAAFALDQHQKATARTLSAQRAGYGAAGVTSEGSPEDVRRQTREQAEIEALAIMWGGEVGADTAFFEGRIAESTAETNQITTILNSSNSIYQILK